MLQCANPECSSFGRSVLVETQDGAACDACGEPLHEAIGLSTTPDVPAFAPSAIGGLQHSDVPICLSCAKPVAGGTEYCDTCAPMQAPGLEAPTRESGDLDEAPVEPAAVPLFSVGIPKLLILSALTWGLYEVYWFFRCWRSFRPSSGTVIAVVAAIASPFFCFPLFRGIGRRAEAAGITDFSPDLSGVAYAACLVLPQLATASFGAPRWVGYVALLAALPVSLVQAAANKVNESEFPGRELGDRWSVGNTLVSLPGALVWLALAAAVVLRGGQ